MYHPLFSNLQTSITTPTPSLSECLKVPPSFSPKIPPPKIHPCLCGSHPISACVARTPSEFLRVSPSFSSKKYSPHYQHITKNFQKKLRKNLQDKKNAVPLHPQMRQNTVSK